ncbi:WAT1-related protein At5g64700 [Malania oleifera]|uniref:WAT1-related protein At5g64700 n=1 Tax=Malania oleifera TaxID=397392 RepID=UPI0025AE49D0|nr:WAT1-related protein At5g64700 [Malania oleifera]
MEGKKAYLAVTLIQTLYAGMFLVSKAAFNDGMNTFIFVFYRQTAATVFLLPITLFLHRKNAPRLSFLIFCKIFMLALCGITLSLDVNGIALVYTSPTLAAATTNCLPVIIFFFAVLLRVEVLRWRTRAGMAKVGGILICLGGAAMLALYKGPHWTLPQLYHYHNSRHHDQTHVASGNSWIKGCILMLTSNALWALWIVLQAGVLKSYPSKLHFTTLNCLLSSIQSFVIAIAAERDFNQWKLGWNRNLIAVAYCGIVVTGVTYYLQAWVVEKKGPVFLAMSTPLAFVLTVFCSTFLLGDVISLGSIIGGILLIGGLYSVLWGKSREQQKMTEVANCALPVQECGKECTESSLKETSATESTQPPFLV